MSTKFIKRIFTPITLLKDFGFLILSIPHIIALARNKEITKVFMEKIMTIVTAVNGCVYCAWFHAKKAAACGISREEVKNMLDLQFKADSSDYEIMGLLFAQHFAETNRKPEKEMTEKLYNFYGKKTATHIILIIRMISFGNLAGNTFDAFLSRLKGNKAEKSNVVFEFLFFIVSAPFLLPIKPFTRKYR